MKNIDCKDIYLNEFDRRIKGTTHLRESWLSSSITWDDNLFQYADPDFYFYRYIIERQERNVEDLITNLLYSLMERYGVPFDIPVQRKNAPFSFIIHEDNKRLGFRFTDFYENEDVNCILKKYNVDSAYVLRLEKTNKARKHIQRENEQYKNSGIRLRVVLLETFFKRYFGEEEYSSFKQALNDYLAKTKEIIGYKPIKFLSNMNLASQKVCEEKYLAEWDYSGYQYQIIDIDNKKIQRYKYLSDPKEFAFSNLKEMCDRYITSGLFKTMTGKAEHAESFVTSEWLFYSLKGKKNFDYTAVISGYLKSIEQLLYKIVMMNIDNRCRISMSGANEKRRDAYENNVTVYEYEKHIGFKTVNVNSKKEYLNKKYLYIDFVSEQGKYMDQSMGSFEKFLKVNPHIFVNPDAAKDIANMISCFRTECRNGFFHTHNLNDWEVVEKTRDNAVYLYFVLLSSLIIPSESAHGLDIVKEDMFDNLCKRVRTFAKSNTSFIFEYDDGRKEKLIYDCVNNVVEFANDGTERYQSLLFYKVDDFSLKSYETLDLRIRDRQKVYLTRESLPVKIYFVNRNQEIEKVELC